MYGFRFALYSHYQDEREQPIDGEFYDCEENAIIRARELAKNSICYGTIKIWDNYDKIFTYMVTSQSTKRIVVAQLVPQTVSGTNCTTYVNEKICVNLKNPLLIIKAKKGMLVCTYLNLATLEANGEVAAVVNVKDFSEMESAKIIGTTSAARALGINIGDLGSEALRKME